MYLDENDFTHATQAAASPDGKSQRLRNSALTWDVPLAVDEQPVPADGNASSKPSVSSPEDTAVNQPVLAQRTAFDTIALAHLRRVVDQLLDAQHPEVHHQLTIFLLRSANIRVTKSDLSASGRWPLMVSGKERNDALLPSPKCRGQLWRRSARNGQQRSLRSRTRLQWPLHPLL